MVIAAAAVMLAAGCESPEQIALERELAALQEQTGQLRAEIQKAHADNAALQQRLRVLSGLERLEPEELYDLQSIELTRYTGFYDKDGDGRKEKLIVYLQPIDSQGDVIKAVGGVDVELWDLHRQPEKALLGSWHVGPEQMRRLWFSTLLKTNYRLVFDVADVFEKFDRPLTVYVRFTDYSTGRVFEALRLLKPE